VHARLGLIAIKPIGESLAIVVCRRPTMFDARHPEFSAPAAPAPALAGLAPIKIAPDVFGKVGEYFTASLSSLQRSLAALSLQPIDLHRKLDAVSAEIARLEQFGVQVQQLARVLGGHAPLARERVDLAATARYAAAEWSRMAQPEQPERAGVTGRTPGTALDVNPAVLAQLLDFGMEYALLEGSAVDVGVTLAGQPPRPTLTITTRRANGTPRCEAEADEVHWLLFVQLARAMGLAPHRLVSTETTVLTLGIAAADDGSAEDPVPSPALPHTASASGKHVLLIEANEFARIHAHKLLREIGVRVDASSSLEQARAGLSGDPPDAVITGVPVADERCGTLLDAIRAEQPRLRVIELVDADAAFSLSLPGADHPARVGRQELARTLTRALAQELDAAWLDA
jgi:hypothetical protein